MAQPLFAAQTVGGGYDTSHRWEGPTKDDQHGWSVSGAGDVNGDGFNDVIVGAPSANPSGKQFAGSAMVYSGTDGPLLWQWDSKSMFYELGRSVAAAGDLNGDGFDDVIVGIPGGLGQRDGLARAYSGADGSVLYRWPGEGPLGEFGTSVAGAGDVNGDGVPDVIIGAPLYIQDAGAAYVYSGADGTQLYKWDAGFREHFGWSVAAAGDVNLDGFADVIVGAADGDLWERGSATVFSGADGSELYYWNSWTNNAHFGSSVAGGGDVNGDGHPDLIVGIPEDDLGGPLSEAGAVEVYSGKNGALLHRWTGFAQFDHFGSSVANVGDINQDGFADVIVGAPGADPKGLDLAGSVYIFSGADGALLHLWTGRQATGQLGFAVANAGDTDGDGLTDFVVGAPTEDLSWAVNAGAAYLYSDRPFLEASGTEISIAAGGGVDFEIKFPREAAGYEYKLLASESGTGPTLFGVEIPLTFDRITQRSWDGSYSGVSAGQHHGVLDAEGSAQALIYLMPGARTDLIGFSLHIAAVALQPGGIPKYSSVAVPLVILP